MITQLDSVAYGLYCKKYKYPVNYNWFIYSRDKDYGYDRILIQKFYKQASKIIRKEKLKRLL